MGFSAFSFKFLFLGGVFLFCVYFANSPGQFGIKKFFSWFFSFGLNLQGNNWKKALFDVKLAASGSKTHAEQGEKNQRNRDLTTQGKQPSYK